MLSAIKDTTRLKPAGGHRNRPIRYDTGYFLQNIGLVDYRCFDPELGSGGFFITDAGKAALARHRAQP